MDEKICSTCGQLKPLDCFGKDKRAKNGLRSQCKECEKKYQRTRNQDKKRAHAKKYRETHREIEKARLQKWKSAEPEKFNANRRFQKLKRRRLVSEYDATITLEKLYNLSGGVCALCGGLCNYEDYENRDSFIIVGNSYPSIDHIKPISKGGSHTWDNVQLVHKQCNSIKSNKETFESLF